MSANKQQNQCDQASTNSSHNQQRTDQQQQQDSSNSGATSKLASEASEARANIIGSGHVAADPMDIADSGVVVSGIAGRFPASDNMNEFQHNLNEGIDMVADPDDKRYPLGLWDLPRRAGRIKDISRFDYEFFGYSKETADLTEHQLRILYEVIYESIVDAGINPASLRGSKTGLFLGLHTSEFENAVAEDIAFKGSGYYSQLAIKTAQYFGFRGHVSTYDAACASAFVALHNAVASIQLGLVDQAIVCGTNISIHPINSFIFLQMQMLSTSGYSRFLDSRADGYVKSEACVSVLLQRKPLALRNYTSIINSQCNVDGFKKEGITFPSASSQEHLIRVCKEQANLHTNHVEYLEAHGTGTPAGDPQEAKAISEVYYPADERNERTVGPLMVGSIKTNMGHSEGASGLCSLAKVILMLENEIIYKSLHFMKPNPTIESLMDGRLQVVLENKPLRSKIIPMSCYGFGGANVHGIFRANARDVVRPVAEETDCCRFEEQWRLICMFGRTEDKVQHFFNSILSDDMKSRTLTRDFLALVDSLSSGPIDRLMRYRGVLIVDLTTQTELYRSVKACNMRPPEASGEKALDLGRPQHHFQEAKQKSCYFVYPGLGCAWNGMGKQLQQCPSFWCTIERLNAILEPFEFDLIETLTEKDTKFSIVDTFVGVTAMQIALTNLLKSSLNIVPTGAIIGHSLGEIACAYADGILDERETILLAYYLSSTLLANGDSIAGSMVAINRGSEELQNWINKFYASNEQQPQSPKTLYIGCDNGPQWATISGTRQQVDEFVGFVERQPGNTGIQFTRLNVEYGLHNPHIMGSDIRNKLVQSVRKLLFAGTDYSQLRSGKWISSVVSGPREQNNIIANAEYFASNLCERVEFRQAVATIDEDSIVIEIGPHGLFEPILRSLMGPDKLAYVKLMKRDDAQNANLTLFSGIGSLFQAGLTVDLLHSDLYPSVQFPVRRQVPSLSSLIQWDHSDTMFVPKYPDQFGKSSAKSELPIELVQERDKYLVGHTVEGRVLFPATGYLFYVWRVFSFTKRQIYDASYQNTEDKLVPIEFHNVRLHRAVMLSGSSLTRLYINLEVTTGQFEVKEGDSVVVDGSVKSPEVNPNGLLYEDIANRIRGENLKLTLSHDDVYKSFRVNGYDYGETFRCIQSASSDGRFVQVKFNGEMVALTDNILQSIFLAICTHAPTGGLFLPTRFDYVRFNPDKIFEKLTRAGVKLDKLSKTLDTGKAREAMKNMMLRHMNSSADDSDTQKESAPKSDEKEANDEVERVCIFDTFCDLVTGIIVTDGVEMRGIRATPAPRRELNKPLLESYKFMPDIEEPVRDFELSGNAAREYYCRICNNVVYELIKLIDHARQNGKQAGGPNNSKLLKNLVNGYRPLTKQQIEQYMNEKLKIRRGQLNQSQSQNDNTNQQDNCSEGNSQQQQNENEKSKTQPIDADFVKQELAKNQPWALLSLLDSVWSSYVSSVATKSTNTRRETRLNALLASIVTSCEEHENLLARSDIIKSSLISERFIRPTIEMIIENSCHSANKLRLMEINVGQNIQHSYLKKLVQEVAPNVALDFTLAHPNPKELQLQSDVKTHTLKDVASDTKCSLLSLVQEDRLLDAICYFDSSCYAPMMLIESNGLGPILSTLTQIVRQGGFLIAMMRHSLSMAERFIMATRQYKPDDAASTGYPHSTSHKSSFDDAIIEEVHQIQLACDARIKLLVTEAKRCNMTLISKRQDTTGCTVFLFQVHKSNQQQQQQQQPQQPDESDNIKMIHVRHQDYASWLRELKNEFKPESGDTSSEQASGAPLDSADASSNNPIETHETTSGKKADKKADRTVWLCAVATKDNPVNGLVGMIQCLRRELGSKNLRCFYDMHTFRERHESEVSLQDIRMSENFATALKRNMIWNCINSNGNWGSWRHITLTDYFDTAENATPTDTEATGATFDRSHHRIESAQAYANVSIRGDLSSFRWYEAPFAYLSETERKQLVKVHYSALNFRDVMLATGRLPLDALPPKLALNDCLLGLEFAGIDLHQNRRVAGMVFGRGIATQVICPDRSAIKFEIPDEMSLREAATIPVVYATAIMALINRGKIQSGESILIHAGSGGVGQAAIRLAMHHKLEVFTTVGSDEKRQFLLDEFNGFVKPDHIFSSRDCSFEGHIMRATNGRGVDLVLNSLADDKLQASVRCLAENGRFLEIGKYDLAMNNSLELLKLDVNKSFHGIVLDMLFETDKVTGAFSKQLNSVLTTLTDGMRQGYIKPIKNTLFAKHELEKAFRYMATGKHIGKVLIEIEPEQQLRPPAQSQPQQQLMPVIPRFMLDPTKAYIITGGLGGFGLELIKWLAAMGARYLVVTSRKGFTTGYQRVVLERLRRNLACQYVVVDGTVADGTTRQGVQKIFQLAKQLSPVNKIGGLFHLAMVLKDSLLENMTSEHFELVCQPKADACILLDDISRQEAPDMSLFVTFSSVSCGKGNAGQSNYGYANSIMERICENRRKHNLHGLAIQWGAIGDVGVAYENLGGNDIVIGGTIPQRMSSCFATLANLLCSPFAVCSSIVQIDQRGHETAKGDLVAAVLHVLGIKDASKVSEQANLGELGLDSLMAVEIRQYIEREYELTLNVQEIRALTIAKIREIGEGGHVQAKQNTNQTCTASTDDSNAASGQQGASQAKIDLSQITTARLNKDFIAGFRPQLQLPKADSVNLNQHCLSATQSRPIFFIPPIHGEFKRMRLISEQIARPCIGLNWTKQLGKTTTAHEAARAYVDILETLNWHNGPQQSDNGLRIVDLVGYSFGATIAFEILTFIQNNASKVNLTPGCLILLDGSPGQIELGSQFMANLTRNKPLTFSEKVNEILLLFIVHHTKHLNVDHLSIREKLISIESNTEAKLKYACDTLTQLLNITDLTRQVDLAHAVEAFCRRYEIISNYRTKHCLMGDVTLIRARQNYLDANDGNEKKSSEDDYSLSKVINGKVDLHILEGNHESFIDNNVAYICKIINDKMVL